MGSSSNRRPGASAEGYNGRFRRSHSGSRRLDRDEDYGRRNGRVDGDSELVDGGADVRVKERLAGSGRSLSGEPSCREDSQRRHRRSRRSKSRSRSRSKSSRGRHYHREERHGHRRHSRRRHQSRSASRSRSRRHRDRRYHNDGPARPYSSRRSPSAAPPTSLRQKEMEYAQREDLTVLVANLGLNTTERDIYEAFSEHAGKVRDVQCVRDARSGHCKGVAYVEFYTQDAVLKALSMTGFALNGQRIRVQSSQAEKNRAAKAAKLLEQQALDVGESTFTIFVGGLDGPLSQISHGELKQLFSPFGTILDVEIQRSSVPGDAKGVAFLKFKRASEAKEAMVAMDGFEIGGQQIKVGYASAHAASRGVDLESLDDEQGLLSGASTKIALMQKLQRNAPVVAGAAGGSRGGVSGVLGPGNSLESAGGALGAGGGVHAEAQQQVTPTQNITLYKMFSPSDPEVREPGFFEEISQDVDAECRKYGLVEKVWINSRALDGKVWLRFATVEDAQRARERLNGRFFAGCAIVATFVPDHIFNAVVEDDGDDVGNRR